MDLTEELQKIYDSEINFSIETFWDGGFTFKLGLAEYKPEWEYTFQTFERGVVGLILKVIELYSESTYSQSKIRAWNKISEGFVDLNKFTDYFKVEMLISKENKLFSEKINKEIKIDMANETGKEIKEQRGGDEE